MVKICLLAYSYKCIQNQNVSDLEKSRNRVISHDPLLEASKFCILCSSTIPTEEILQKTKIMDSFKNVIPCFLGTVLSCVYIS